MTNDPILEPTPPATDEASASAPAKICLVLLFNHRYDANLPKLERIYRGRFEHIRFLVPFYRGDRADVYPVYYSSYQFQGFFLTAWERLREEGFTHFFFLADDMILAPGLNETNLLTRLKVGANTAYTKDLYPITTGSPAWFPFMSALVAVAGTNGVNWKSELPEPAAAAANLAAKGYPMGRFGWHNLSQGSRTKAFFQIFFYFAHRFNQRRKDPRVDLLGPPYPMLRGNVDIIIVPAGAMEKFCAYCSVFAAMGVFVEVGGPTALALSCARVTTQKDIDLVGLDWFPDPETLDAYCRQYDYNLDRLFAEFDDKLLCLHPVKLSKWHFAS